MNKLKLLLLVIVFLFPIFLTPPQLKAQASDNPAENIKYENINLKDGYTYYLKRLKEKINLVILSYNSQKKLNYYEKLLNIRLAELKFVVDNKDITNIQVASQRYFATAGQLTSFLISKNELTANKEAVKELFSQHIKIIEVLEKTYDNTSAEWRFLRDDANYLVDYSKLLI